MPDNPAYQDDLGPAWDLSDADNPQPLIYPECPACGAAWVYERCLSLRTGQYRWAWFKPKATPGRGGCRHKGDPALHRAKGVPDHE